ncbi:MAG: 3-hydroxyacyl-CoA dehydrogenase [Cytophagales bacterium]|nr:3-hydroxyacyl-CoA dehydrogenase [Cytophagales bacterium]
MEILVVGEQNSFDEFREKFISKHSYTFIGIEKLTKDVVRNIEVVFDFTLENNPEGIKLYLPAPLGIREAGSKQEKLVLFVNAVKISLAEIYYKYPVTKNSKSAIPMFGFNGLPTMVNRTILEVSIPDEKNADILDRVCKDLGTEYLVVKDRVGMVTPRVICMIINEACYTLQEGTASIADIDQGMKLGTNYPYGPFQWADMIGVKNVYETLKAIYEDTKEERYKTCPLLKEKYLKKECFY